MPLNYSKWDNLELSDDSDIEVHPNVDKKSFIKWKQADIHEKRLQRKQDIDNFNAEVKLNDDLHGRLDKIISDVSSEGNASYSRLVAQLDAERKEAGGREGAPTPSDMVLSLLLQINDAPAVKGKQGTELDEALVAELKDHRSKLAARTVQCQAELAKLKEEDARKITSDGIKEGWSTGHVTKPEPEAATSSSSSKAKTKAKKTETSIETLNSPGTAAAAAAASTTSPDSDAEDDDEEVLPLSSDMSKFIDLDACIPPRFPLSTSALPADFTPKRDLRTSAFEAAYRFLSEHRQILQPGVSDTLLVEAFQACMREDAQRGRRATEKGLMLQYCHKLGKDGVSLFFKRMAMPDGRAATVFFNDVLTTFARIHTRSRELSADNAAGAASGAEGVEQIQLVAEDPSTVIGFEVPDGPPPAHIELEGEGAETMDVEKVREFLQRRWDIFEAFDEDLKEALKTKELEKVNKVLGKMECEKAEKVVALLDEAGILSFSSSEIVDETQKGKALQAQEVE